MEPKLFRIGIVSIVVIIVAAITIAMMAASPQLPQQVANAFVNRDPDWSSPKAPMATSGDNVYIAWMTDKGTPNTNAEIIFRASNDSGETFGNKINLSNSSNIDSVDQEIAAEGENVFVTWWERNATSNTPVIRISTD
ncbi:MAG: hypothetical protein ACRD8Z_10100, partial [Nitrososphaeraceae archaeon]